MHLDTQIKRIHKTLVITSFNRELYEQYAQGFWHTFPHDLLDLKVYSEETLAIKTTHLHLHCDFVERNSYRPVSSYKHDSVRFCYKVYSIAQALEDWALDDYDRLLWIDADTRFHKHIDEDWITHNLYKGDCLMSYAGRHNLHSECGLLLFNLEHPSTHSYIASVRKLYDTDMIYLLREWHDSFVFDQVRMQYEAKGNRFHNLAAHIDHKVPGSHILAYLYGDTLDHMKGKRKQRGHSKEQQNHEKP